MEFYDTYEMVRVTREIEQKCYYIGYTIDEGQVMTLVGVTEFQADGLIEEFKTKGTITLKTIYGCSTETITPLCVIKFESDKTYYSVDVPCTISIEGMDSSESGRVLK